MSSIACHLKGIQYLVLFPVPRREYSQLLPVLRDCAPRYDQPVLLEEIGDLLIAHRLLWIFFRDDLLDIELGALRRDFAA